MPTQKKDPRDRGRTCSDGYFRGISFRVPASVIARLPLQSGVGLSGRLVKGKFVIDQGARGNVFLPRNICWWEELRKAKRAAAAKASKRRSSRRSRSRAK